MVPHLCPIIAQKMFTIQFYSMRITFHCLLFALLCSTLTTACGIFNRLTSTTQIEASKSFVLGEGKHGSYKATIKNVSKCDVEVLKSGENDQMVSLGLLTPTTTKQFNIPSNTKVVFKNLGKTMAAIEINLSGDTGLSMGYKDNK